MILNHASAFVLVFMQKYFPNGFAKQMHSICTGLYLYMYS